MVNIICEVIGAVAMIIVALISKNTNKKVDKISTLKEEFKKEIGTVSQKIDSNEKDYLRFQILSFAGDLRNGIKKTRQEFETIFTFYDKYEEIINELGMHNGYLDSEFDFVKEEYKKI